MGIIHYFSSVFNLLFLMAVYPCPQYVPPIITVDNYNALVRKIMSGTRVVQYADKRVEYHSLEDMMKIRAWMESVLYPCSGAGRPTKVSAHYVSGLNSCDDRRLEDEEYYRFR